MNKIEDKFFIWEEKNLTGQKKNLLPNGGQDNSVITTEIPKNLTENECDNTGKKKKVSGIYKIINKVNGHYYVGSSININKRWQFHRSRLTYNLHTNKHLQRAWNKYGKENFEFVIVEYLQSDKEILNTIENRYLSMAKNEFHNTYNSEFSVNEKGFKKVRREPNKPRKQRQKLSEESRKRISNAMKKSLTEERKQAISNCMKGKYVGANNPMYGKKHTPESIEKMRKKKNKKTT